MSRDFHSTSCFCHELFYWTFQESSIITEKTYYSYQARAKGNFVKYVVAIEMPRVYTTCRETGTCVAYSTVTPELVRKLHNRKQNTFSDI